MSTMPLSFVLFVRGQEQKINCHGESNKEGVEIHRQQRLFSSISLSLFLVSFLMEQSLKEREEARNDQSRHTSNHVPRKVVETSQSIIALIYIHPPIIGMYARLDL